MHARSPRRKPSEKPERERDARFARKNRMHAMNASRSTSSANVFVHACFQRCLNGLARDVRFHFVTERHVLIVPDPRVAKLVQRSVLGDGHQPCAGLVGHARARPLVESRHERLVPVSSGSTSQSTRVSTATRRAASSSNSATTRWVSGLRHPRGHHCGPSRASRVHYFALRRRPRIGTCGGFAFPSPGIRCHEPGERRSRPDGAFAVTSRAVDELFASANSPDDARSASP